MIERCWLIGHTGWYGRHLPDQPILRSLNAAEALAVANTMDRPKARCLWANRLTWSDIMRTDAMLQYLSHIPYCHLGGDDAFRLYGRPSRVHGYDTKEFESVPGNVVVASYDSRFMVFIDTMGAPC